MKQLAALLVLALSLGTGRAEDDAVSLLRRVMTNRPTKDLSLKGRLFVTREQAVPVEVLIHHTPADTRTIYRGDKTELLVIQPLEASPQYFLKGEGELTGARRMEKLLGSQFVFYDLGLPFLRWPVAKFLSEERMRGRDCYLIEARAEKEPYAYVKLWLDKEYGALLSMVAFDADDQPVRRFSVNSFKHMGAVWIPRGMESAFVPAGQAMPAEVRSRLEIYDGNYDAKLPVEWFDPAGFGAAAP